MIARPQDEAGRAVALQRADKLAGIVHFEAHLAAIAQARQNPGRTTERQVRGIVLQAAAHHRRVVRVDRNIVELRNAKTVGPFAPRALGQWIDIHHIWRGGHAAIAAEVVNGHVKLLDGIVRLLGLEQERIARREALGGDAAKIRWQGDSPTSVGFLQ